MALSIGGQITDGSRFYSSVAANGYWCGHFPTGGVARMLSIDGTTRYLKITSFKVYWYQAGAADDLDRVVIYRRDNVHAADLVLDDGTNRGAAGENSFEYACAANNVLSATEEFWSFYINFIVSGSGNDWRMKGVKIEYEYE